MAESITVAGGWGSTSDPTATAGDYQYAGYRYDAETLQYYVDARYLQADNGRWTTQDPSGLGGGDTNFYRYVHNNTTNATDPTGLEGTPLWARAVNWTSNILGNQQEGWLAQTSDGFAGFADASTAGLAGRVREGLGYNDVVNRQSLAYAVGHGTGTVATIAAGFVNPCGVVFGVSLALRGLNVVQAVGGVINAVENYNKENYWGAAFDALGVLGNVAQLSRACFSGDTELMARGLCGQGWRRIDKITTADEVLSRDENDPDGPLVWKKVEEVFERWAFVHDLNVGGRTIGTTLEHPFYAVGKGWTEVSALVKGDRIPGMNARENVPVQAVGDSRRYGMVYNLRVADYHTYFVGGENWGFSIWAHNAKYKNYDEHIQRNKEQIKGGVESLLEKEAEILGNKVQRAGKTGQRIAESLRDEAEQALEALRRRRQGQ